MTELFKQLFCNVNETFSIIIEDDGRVAYAYLYEKEDIIGDIWLYNQIRSPVEVNWKDTDNMPFLNPKEYIKEELLPIINDSAIDLAKLLPGSTPGWSKIVTKDGPLAKVYK